MSRAEIRRAAKAAKKKTVTYNLTQEQLDAIVAQKVNEFVDKEFAKIRDNVVNDAMIAAVKVTLTIPLEILMDEYWPKSYHKKLPKFTERMLEIFELWQDGKYDLRAATDRLWTVAGIRLEEK